MTVAALQDHLSDKSFPPVYLSCHGYSWLRHHLHWGALLWLHITWSFICFAYFGRHVRSGHNQCQLFLDWPNEFWRHQSGRCIHRNHSQMAILSPVGMFLWDRLEKGQTFGDLLTALLAEYDVSREEAVKDIEDFLSELDAHQYLLKEKEDVK